MFCGPECQSELSNILFGTTSEPSRRHYKISKQLLNELWNFTVDAHAHCTHSIVDRSIIVSFLTGCRT